MEKIGLEAVFQDANFQAGLKRYVDGQKQMEKTTDQATKAIGVHWNEAAKRWVDANNKFVSSKEVERRLEELKTKFPAVAQVANETGNAVEKAGKKVKDAGDKIGTTAQKATGATSSFSTLKNALGSVGDTAATAAKIIAGLSLAGIAGVGAGILGSINITRQWGEQLDTLGDVFGSNALSATGMAVALKTVGLSVEEGSSSFSYFSRQVSSTKEQLTEAASTFASATSEISAAHRDAIGKIARDWTEAQAEAAVNIGEIWTNLEDQRASIEADAADRITSINESLQERLSDLAEQRQELQKDTAKSLAKLEDDTRDRLRNAHSARDRRQIRKDAAERKKELLEQAAEREKQIAKQEAREKAQAAKQIALAEKVADKQIQAAEKAANKQVEAIEKALAKQQKAVNEQIADQDKAAAKQFAAAAKALNDAQTKNPLAKALKELGLNFNAISDESRPFTDRLGDIMDAFAKLPEGVDASAIAMQLFGKAGIKWLDFLRLGRKGLEDARKLGIDLGLVLDPAQVEAYGRELNKLSLGFEAIGVNIGREVLPFASEFVKSLNSMIREAMPAFQGFLKRLSDAFKSGGLQGLGQEFWKALTEPKGIFDQLGKIVGQIRDWFTTGEGSKILSGAGSALNAVIDAFGAWAASKEGATAIEAATKTLTDAVGAGIALAIKTAKWIADVMTQLTDRLNEWVMSGDGQKAIAGIATNIVTSLLRGLESGFSSSKAESPMDDLSVSLGIGAAKNANILLGIGSNVGTAVINGIQKAFTGRDLSPWWADWLRTNLRKALVLIGGPWAVLADTLFGPSGVMNAPATPALPWGGAGEKFQSGGWVHHTGLAKVDMGEYVLNRQQAMQFAPMLTSPNNSRTYNFYHTWPAGVPTSQQQWTEGMVRRVTQQEMRGILGKG